MDLYVITDPKREVIYGVIEAASEHDALRAVIDNHQQVLFDGERGAREVEAQLVEQLADGRWREVAPLGAGPAGDCGGDVQTSNAWGRRFALVRPDRTWAVLSLSWYAINESAEFVGASTQGEVIERQAWMDVAEDLRDLDVVESWEQQFRKIKDFTPDDAGAEGAAEAFTIGDIEWDGNPQS
jgi:hypothetical protein